MKARRNATIVCSSARTASGEMSPTQAFRSIQMRAQEWHRTTGETFCLLALATPGHLALMREQDVIAAGQDLIDLIIWTTDFSGTDRLDTALIA